MYSIVHTFSIPHTYSDMMQLLYTVSRVYTVHVVHLKLCNEQFSCVTFHLQAESVCDFLTKVQSAIQGGNMQSAGITAILTAVELLAKGSCSEQTVRVEPHIDLQ